MMKLLTRVVSIAAAVCVLTSAPLEARQQIHDAAFSSLGLQRNRIGTVSPELATLLQNTADSLFNALEQVFLTTPDNQPIPPDAQAFVLNVINGHVPPGDLAEILGGGDAAQDLATNMVAILTEGDAQQIANAIAAYQVFLAQAPPAFLANPPGEFLAVWAILAALANTASQVPN